MRAGTWLLSGWIAGCAGGGEGKPEPSESSTPLGTTSPTTEPTEPTDTGDGPVDADGDGSPAGVDCDDADPAVSPDAVEQFDGFDDDCDGDVDCDDADLQYVGDVWSPDLGGLCAGRAELCVTGDVSMYADVPSLEGLRCVVSIGGDLLVSDNHVLTSLAGLEQLQEVGGLSFSGDGALGDLSALSSLRVVRGYAYFYGLDALGSLHGLDALEQVDGTLTLGSNLSLASLDGLGALASVGSFVAWSNPSLASLDGAEALTRIDGALHLGHHPYNGSLSGNFALADVTGLNGLVEVGGDVWITGNTALGDAAAQALVAEIDTIGGEVEVYANQ